jgi:hypothetical protein
VIPEFGGFVANYQSAKIDPVVNLMHAPKKHIVFNKSLQNNDGLLINEVASVEGMSFKKAKSLVEEYVADLKDQLHLHQKVVIQEVGTVMKSSNNTLLFVQDLTTNHLLSSYGMGNIQSPAIIRKSVQERLGQKIKTLDTEHLPKSNRPWLKAAAVLLPLAMVSVLGINQQERIQTAVANLNPFRTATEVVLDESPAANFSYNINSPATHIEEGLTISFQEQATAASFIEEQTPQHFIVAGAFGTRRNAEKMVRKLQRWNYSDAAIIGQSKNGLIRVAYAGFNSLEDAQLSLANIKQEHASAWLLSL